MTREEAIKVLNMVEAHGIADEAKRMAIEALSADTIPIEKYHELQHQFVMLGATFADLTEVVRCKDCRWWSCTDSLYQHNSHLCRYWKSTNTSAEDFCSYGERQCNYFGERGEE